MHNRIVNPNLTYGKRLLNLIKKKGYINTHVELSKNNKQISINSLNNTDSNECEVLNKYLNIALVEK